VTARADDAHPSRPARPASRGRSRKGTPPAGTETGSMRAASTPTPPDGASNGRKRRFDRLDSALAPSPPGRRGPPAVRARITWASGPAAEALGRTQGRVLRDLLAALTARQ
jgi:hypothetical protein